MADDAAPSTRQPLRVRGADTAALRREPPSGRSPGGEQVHDRRHRPARSSLAKLRPAKLRDALGRRWFERRAARIELTPMPGLLELGSAYGGWILPAALIDSSWTCYLVGAGGDISVDLELVRDHGAKVRTFDAVAEFAQQAQAEGAGEQGFSAHHAAIACKDGPLRMTVSEDPRSRAVSAAGLGHSRRFIELPGRTLPSLMAELGDARIDLLKLDVEGSEYELLETIALDALGVKVFAVQLHHNGTVRDARALIARLRAQGYRPVACKPPLKVTFVRSALL